MMFLFFNNSISAGTADTVSAVCRPRPRQAGGQRRQNQPQGGIRIQSQQNRPDHRRRGGAARPQRRAEQNRHQTGLADAPLLQRQNPQTLHRPCRRPVPHERQVQEEAAAQNTTTTTPAAKYCATGPAWAKNGISAITTAIPK